MKLIDFEALLLGAEPASFLLEVGLRTFIMFVFILLALRVSGKRGVKQLSVFELVVIIGLGSAAGDPMFYKEVGILPALLVFSVVVGLYRFTTWLTTRSKAIEHVIEGKPLYFIREGKFAIDDFDREDLSQDEFFAELRSLHVEHLGQVKSAVMETSGVISILFYPDNEVKPGLPIFPDEYGKKSEVITKPGLYSCAICGYTAKLKGSSKCEVCGKKEWVLALNTIRSS